MSDLLSKLNNEQVAATIHKNGPAVVLAGAGSGKTTVLTSRVSWLIEKRNISPYSILVVTFTNKAAKEIKERILKLTGHILPWSGTFHSFCAKILRIDGDQIDLGKNFVIYDSADQISLIKNIYKEFNFDKEEFNIKAVQTAISSAKNELLSNEDYQQIASGTFQNHIARVYKIYQHKLNKASAVDFDDLLSKTLNLLKTSKETREKYQRMFEHVLIDEYQDTNKAQYELTKILSAPQDNIFVVGDFCQSIYAWRGADYKNMLQLKKSFPKIKEYKLEQNYRSTQNILDAATEVISQNTSHPILKLWTTKQAGSKITCYEANSGKGEAKQVIKFIKTHQKKFDYGNFAILYRTNAQSREFEEALIGGGIPYRLIGGTKFYERKEVKDLIAYLRFSVNRDDIVSYQRILKLGQRRFANFMSWLEKTKITNTAAEILKEILEVTKYIDKFKRDTEENITKKENVEELLNVATQFDNVSQFLENIALIQDNQFADKGDANENNYYVNLMSLHSAKGLEFEVVLMVGMEDGLLPHSRSLMDNDQMEEERRLCYVGITRAKSYLYLTYSRSRFQYGTNISAIRSRFIEDIPKQLLNLELEPKKYKVNREAREGALGYKVNREAREGALGYKVNREAREGALGYKVNREAREGALGYKVNREAREGALGYNINGGNYDGGFNKKPIKPTRRIVVDEDLLDGVLAGDFDIDKLIES